MSKPDWMKLTFLGTGTSMGVPVAGGFGQMKSTDPRDQRWRCSAWIQTPLSSIVIDIGPEFRLQTLRSGIKRIDALLITHEHIDHIGGLDDLRPFNYVQNQRIPAYTTPSCIEAIHRRYDYMFGPNRTSGSVEIELSTPTEPFTFQDCTITPLKALHGGLEIMGFKVNDLCYITDVKEMPEETKLLIKDAKVLVINGLRWEKPHPTHLTIPEAVALSQEIGVERTYFIHMNSFVLHEEINKKLPPGMELAYDTLSVFI